MPLQYYTAYGSLSARKTMPRAHSYLARIPAGHALSALKAFASVVPAHGYLVDHPERAARCRLARAGSRPVVAALVHTRSVVAAAASAQASVPAAHRRVSLVEWPGAARAHVVARCPPAGRPPPYLCLFPTLRARPTPRAAPAPVRSLRLTQTARPMRLARHNVVSFCAGAAVRGVGRRPVARARMPARCARIAHVTVPTG
jgi:hypothetical protein